jgi:Putative transposase/Transposase zinc-binding domain
MAAVAPPGAGATTERGSRVELADIVRAYGATYRRTHVLARAQGRALRAIEVCRTAVLGGHRAVCTTCGAERITYNSCRNRHCPKCQRVATERWLAARRRDLLPIPYFHVVFTLPHALNPLAQSHPRLIYRLLFQAAATTLARFGRDPRHLGGELGITAILHTWGQNLSQHLHVHCVVTGGALAADGSRWVAARPSFLFPVRALAKLFRGLFLADLQRAVTRGETHFTGGLAALAAPDAFAAWLTSLRTSAWVVYCKAPFAGPEHVLAYLGRYTHRVAISNDRLVACVQGRVRFHWRDYADGDRVKVLDLEAAEFLRRFLLHVVPDGFVRIRHFGLLANRTRAAKLARARARLAQPPPPPPEPPAPVRVVMLRVSGIDIDRCPVCRLGLLRRVGLLPPARPDAHAPPRPGPSP